jgi:hypothetical protein
MTIAKFSPLSSPSQKGVTITQIGITKIGIPIWMDRKIWDPNFSDPDFSDPDFGDPDFSDPDFGDEVMESEFLHFQKMRTKIARFRLFAKCPKGASTSSSKIEECQNGETASARMMRAQRWKAP